MCCTMFPALEAKVNAMLNSRDLQKENKVYFGSEDESPDMLEFLNVKATIFAQQMTLIDADLYGKITSSECEIWPTLSKHSTTSEQTSHINAVIRHHNQTHIWATRMLIESNIQEKHMQVTHRLIAIADACYALNNFATLVAIISALTDDQARGAIKSSDAKAQAKFKRLQQLVSPAKGFIEFRRALRLANLPCVPFLGFMLTDLKFIEEGIPRLRRDGTLNDKKISKTKDVIAELQRYQSKPFQIGPVPEVQNMIVANLRDQPTLDQYLAEMHFKSREKPKIEALRFKEDA